jgi:formylglycine-generating enzyme required for sulfatase activity
MVLLDSDVFARPGVGKLKVTCYPKAYISIDGQAALSGSAKKLEIVVDVGPHVVTAEAADYQEEVVKIEVLPNQTTTLNLVLVRADQDRNQMAKIPGGEFQVGIDQKRLGWICKNIGGCQDDYKASVPKHVITLKGFYIDKYEVTNRQYKKFVAATRHPAPRHWRGGNYPRQQDDYPVVNVSWSDAAAYCKWAGKRLPTEAEWEVAATGKKGLLYPWGRKFRDDRANTVKERFHAPTVTGRYEKGMSKFGCYDMAGNVWEWTADVYKPYSGSQLKVEKSDRGTRVVRGGSFKDQPFMATTIYRRKLKADGVYDNVGFRCAR